MSSPWMYFSQYLLFLIHALAYTPFFCSSTIPFNTQKPLSRKQQAKQQPNCGTKIIELLLSEDARSIFAFHHINSPHNPTRTTTHRMIFIPKRPRLSGNEHESWKREFVCPDTHRLIQTIHVSTVKMCDHVVPPMPSPSAEPPKTCPSKPAVENL